MFYTRLNHMLFAAAMVALLMPLSVGSRWGEVRTAVGRWRRWREAGIYLGCIAVGVGLLALRTWHYTGVFSVLYRTPRELLSTGLGLSTLGSAEAWGRALGSAWMVMTVHDPGHWQLRGAIVTLGSLCAIAGLLQVPPARRLPVAVCAACAGGIVAALFVRGYAYPGRFSVHIVPLAIAVFGWAAVSVWRAAGIGRREPHAAS
jgi:hypothetical protein